MATEARMVLRADTLTHRFLRARLTFLIASTLVVDAVATVLMYWFEAGDSRSGFDNFGGTLFWVSAQLTTVSSQMPNPVTGAGQVLDILLEVWSISIVATAAASIAAFFHARHLEGHVIPGEAGPTP
jgi:ABC-type phosphate/phosphonate transport system permease subunit